MMASLPVVSSSILYVGNGTFDWLCVPEHILILDEDMLKEWAADFGGENVGTATSRCPDINGPLRPLAPSARFNVVTSAGELASFSKGLVPQNTLEIDEWAVRNF